MWWHGTKAKKMTPPGSLHYARVRGTVIPFYTDLLGLGASVFRAIMRKMSNSSSSALRLASRMTMPSTQPFVGFGDGLRPSASSLVVKHNGAYGLTESSCRSRASSPCRFPGHTSHRTAIRSPHERALLASMEHCAVTCRADYIRAVYTAMPMPAPGRFRRTPRWSCAHRQAPALPAALASLGRQRPS